MAKKRDIVLSIRPVYATKILEGTKTVELRRRFPIDMGVGTIALIYTSSPVQAITGYARITEVLKMPISKIWRSYRAAACISREDFDQYFAGLREGFAILLDKPRRVHQRVAVDELLEDFGLVPPQSFRYVGEEYQALLHDERLQIPVRY
jgi:predicted transcriptional regulator